MLTLDWNSCWKYIPRADHNFYMGPQNQKKKEKKPETSSPFLILTFCVEDTWVCGYLMKALGNDVSIVLYSYGTLQSNYLLLYDFCTSVHCFKSKNATSFSCAHSSLLYI